MLSGPAEMIMMPGTFVVAFASLVAVDVAPLPPTTEPFVESEPSKYLLVWDASIVTPAPISSSVAPPVGGAITFVVAEPVSSVDASEELPA
jgi:hypothetical protein